MSKHDHKPVPQPKPCEHVLKHCKECDAVECETCGKEWVLPCTRPHTAFGNLDRTYDAWPDRVLCGRAGHIATQAIGINA